MLFFQARESLRQIWDNHPDPFIGHAGVYGDEQILLLSERRRNLIRVKSAKRGTILLFYAYWLPFISVREDV